MGAAFFDGRRAFRDSSVVHVHEKHEKHEKEPLSIGGKDVNRFDNNRRKAL